MASEFELIDLFQNIGSKYYKQNGIVISPGDDCAVFDFSKPVITSVDASVVDVHFPSNANPEDIAYRSIAVALSDLAAMGCKPRAFSISLTSPIGDKDWYQGFSKGVEHIADEFRISLIGGDLTKGPLNINVIVYGSPYTDKVLKRNGARVGDYICISSQVGRAAKGLDDWKDKNFESDFIQDYLRPIPKISLGNEIIDIASACIDTSDGLLADMKKIIEASNRGAEVYIDKIPYTRSINDINAGDDYDLCFTVSKENYLDHFIKIGLITDTQEIRLISDKGYDTDINGFDHFTNG